MNTVFDDVGRTRWHTDHTLISELPAGWAVEEGVLGPEWYHNGEVAAQRPTPPMAYNKLTIQADGVDESVISGIPNGALAFVGDDAPVVITDGTLTITSDAPRQFNIRIDAFPYLDYTVTIDAT